jgi:ankyrin repeat protein
MGDTKAGAALLAEGANVNAKDDHGHTPLYTAAGQGHKEMVAFLIEHGAEVNSHPDDGSWRGETPLFKAAKNNHKAVVELLLAKGADVNATDSMGRTPLYRAVEHDYTSVATVLIQHGAAVDGIAKHDTPLNVAIMAGYKDSVQLLAENGADVNATSDEAPLIAAIFRQDAKLVEILLRYGADVNTKTHVGELALDFAIYSGCADIVALLIKPPPRASIAETLPAQETKPAGTAPPLNVGTNGVDRRVSFPGHYEEHLDGWKTLEPKVETALQNSPVQNQESAKTSLVNAIALDIQAHSEVSVYRIAYLQMDTIQPTFEKILKGNVSSFYLFSIERGKHLANSYYWYSRLLREWPNTKLLAIANGDMGMLSFMDLMHLVWEAKYEPLLKAFYTEGIFGYYFMISVLKADDGGGKLTEADELICKNAFGVLQIPEGEEMQKYIHNFLAENVIRHMDLALSAKDCGDAALVPVWKNLKAQAAKILR